MKPTSLASRLLALTPQGRRLFALLAAQQAEITRLREELRLGGLPGAVAPDPEEVAALRALLRGAEAELAKLRAARR